MQNKETKTGAGSRVEGLLPNPFFTKRLRAPCGHCGGIEGIFGPKGPHTEACCLSCGAHCYFAPKSPEEKTPPANRRKPDATEIGIIQDLISKFDRGLIKTGSFASSVIRQYRAYGGLTIPQWKSVVDLHGPLPSLPASAAPVAVLTSTEITRGRPMLEKINGRLLANLSAAEFSASSPLMQLGGLWQPVAHSVVYHVMVRPVEGGLDLIASVPLIHSHITIMQTPYHVDTRAWLVCPWCRVRKGSLFFEFAEDKGMLSCRVCLGLRYQAQTTSQKQRLQSKVQMALNAFSTAAIPATLDHMTSLLSGAILETPPRPPQVPLSGITIPVATIVPQAMVPVAKDAEKQEEEGEMRSQERIAKDPRTPEWSTESGLHRKLLKKGGIWRPVLHGRECEVHVRTVDGIAEFTSKAPPMEELVGLSMARQSLGGMRAWLVCPTCQSRRVSIFFVEKDGKGAMACVECRRRITARPVPLPLAATVIAALTVAAAAPVEAPPVARTKSVAAAPASKAPGAPVASTHLDLVNEREEGDMRSYEKVLVTPALASEWLKKNNKNRPLAAEKVLKFARIIDKGEWKLTHQGVAIDEDGIILDGQHRLAAVVKSGKSVYMQVSINAARNTFDCIDQSPKRTTAQVFASLKIPSASSKAAMVRVAILLGENGLVIQGQPSGTESVTYYQKHQAAVDFVHDNALPNTPMAVYGAILWAYLTYPVQVRDFCLRFKSGANLSVGSPVLALRTWLSTRKKGGGASMQGSEAARALFAINYFIEGKKVKRLYPIESLFFFDRKKV